MRGDLFESSAQVEVLSAQRRQTNIQKSRRQIASDVLHKVRGLLVQSSDDTISAGEREAIQLQVDSSLDAIDSLGSVTGFTLPESLDAFRAGGLANVIDGNPAERVELLEEQLSSINLASATAGAYEKYTLDVDQRLAEARVVATASSLSHIEDADYVQESSNLVKGQILTEGTIKTMALLQMLRFDQISSLFETL